jgi:hypothetical protein
MNNPDHISESLETIFWVQILKFLMRILDPGWKKFESGMNLPDSQHGFFILTLSIFLCDAEEM